MLSVSDCRGYSGCSGYIFCSGVGYGEMGGIRFSLGACCSGYVRRREYESFVTSLCYRGGAGPGLPVFVRMFMARRYDRRGGGSNVHVVRLDVRSRRSVLSVMGSAGLGRYRGIGLRGFGHGRVLTRSFTRPFRGCVLRRALGDCIRQSAFAYEGCGRREGKVCRVDVPCSSYVPCFFGDNNLCAVKGIGTCLSKCLGGSYRLYG